MKKLTVSGLVFFASLNLILSGYSPHAAELFPKEKMDPIILKNRKTLSSIPEWIDDAHYNNAFFYYGLPTHVRDLVDKPMGNEMTYSDAIVYLSSLLKKDINYLEIGTSFGKNFLQIAHALSDSALVGFDIENISPVMESFFVDKETLDQWDTIKDSRRKERSSLAKYNQKTNNNIILYLAGDVYDENSWQHLRGKKFNLIFSDAAHSPEAILHEYRMLEKYDLLDSDEFIVVWDDLNDSMPDAFTQIFNLLSKKYQLKPHQGFIIPLRGWLGAYENHHPVGIIMHLKDQNIK